MLAFIMLALLPVLGCAPGEPQEKAAGGDTSVDSTQVATLDVVELDAAKASPPVDRPCLVGLPEDGEDVVPGCGGPTGTPNPDPPGPCVCCPVWGQPQPTGVECCVVSCNDGNVCTENDTCGGGLEGVWICDEHDCCGQSIDCDDGQICTSDSCDPDLGGCQHRTLCAYTPSPCWSVFCDLEGRCIDYYNCSDRDCFNTSCVDGVCTYTPNCTDNRVCYEPVCDANNDCDSFYICEDNDPCTTDRCIVEEGEEPECTHESICPPPGNCEHVSCDGVCVYTPNCDDSDPCTDDSCVMGDCVRTPHCPEIECKTVTCNDGQCDETPKCDDGDPCTDDHCTDDVCSHTPHCRTFDCSTMTCVDGNCDWIPQDCDDGNECTNDYCENNTCQQEDACSALGKVCCSASCCYEWKCCGTGEGATCCTDNETCCNGICQSPACLLNIVDAETADSACPGSAVVVTISAVCHPHCKPMFLTAVVQPQFQPYVSFSFSQSTVACTAQPTQVTVTVTTLKQIPLGSMNVVITGTIGEGSDELCVATDTVPIEIKNPSILESETTDWLVVHDPTFEADHCQPGSNPQCKQAELMTNKAVVLVDRPDESCEFTVWLVEEGILGDTDIVEGSAITMPDTVEFRFDTVLGSATLGAKTDSQGGIFVNDALLLSGPTGGLFSPDYAFDLRLLCDGEFESIQKVDVTIAPMLTDLSYIPDILANPPETVDPYSDFVFIQPPPSDPILPDGYNDDDFFGLRIEYDLDEDIVFPPRFRFYNDPSIPSWGGDAGIVGPVSPEGDQYYELFFDPAQDASIAEAGVINKRIKWEGFTDNAIVRDGGFAEPGARVFMQGKESELEMPFDMGDGVQQTHRGVASRYVVKEGHYINEFRIRRKLDPDQRQFLQIPLEVKYEIDP